MRICYVIGGLGAGGAERQLLYLVHAMAARVPITVISLSDSSSTLLPAFEGIPRVNIVTVPKSHAIDFRALAELVGLFRRIRPHIVHTFLRTANYWGRLSALLSGIPITIASERNVEKERGILANTLDTILSFATTRIVANAAAVRDSLTKRGVPARRINVIRNGVPHHAALSPGARDRIRTELGVHGRQPLVLFVGRLYRQKNPLLFLHMARKILDSGMSCRFGIVGEGPLRSKIESTTSSLGLDNAIVLTGLRHDVPALLAAADLLVLTSDWEGMPNVILEAMSVGTPAVATDVGGVREIISDGVNGYVVPPRNVERLTVAVTAALSDPHVHACLGRSAREYVEVNFSLDKMVGETVALYNSLLCAKGLPPLPEARPSLA